MKNIPNPNNSAASAFILLLFEEIQQKSYEQNSSKCFWLLICLLKITVYSTFYLNYHSADSYAKCYGLCASTNVVFTNQ